MLKTGHYEEWGTPKQEEEIPFMHGRGEEGDNYIIKTYRSSSFIKELNRVFIRLANLPKGWADCEENRGFSKIFLNQVENILEHLFSEVTSQKRLIFPIIAPMEPNSIDIHWKNDQFQLLINIMETDIISNVELYGRKLDCSDEIKWHGNLRDLRGVILGWLLTKL